MRKTDSNQLYKLKMEWGYLVGLVLAIFVFFPELFLMKQGLLSGDHRVQHVPWSFFLADNLKQLSFPWWSNLFQSGFPLLAEGQIGAFYPINIIFYFLFPSPIAYNYGIITHYCLGAFFFYLYLRSINVSKEASFFGTLIFLFGTSQGGYYYNIISQKVLIWLPLTFYLTDRIIEKGKRGVVFLLALVFSFQWLGGYLQYAVYSIGFTCFYFLWFSIVRLMKEKNVKEFSVNIALLALSGVLSILIASPQLGATWELASFSNRFSFTEAFVYIGSFNPLALATLYFPHWDSFIRAELYVGALGLFFLIFSLFTRKKNKEVFFVALSIITFGLCLGKFNILFVGLIKLTQFYSFRIPTKFLFFVGLSLAVLAAFGFDKWLMNKVSELRQRILILVFGVISFIAVAGFLFANLILRIFRDPISSWIINYIENQFYNPEIHAKPIESYVSRFVSLYDYILQTINPIDFWNGVFLIFVVVSFFCIWGAYKVKGKVRPIFLSIALIGVLFANLFAYGFTSVKGNYEAFSFIEEPSQMVSVIKKDSDLFRVHRVPSTVDASDTIPLIAQNNMLSDIAVTGGYSPLIMKAYYEYMKDLGDVNDSQTLITVSPELIRDNLSLLKLLNVKYLITDQKMDISGLNLILTEESNYLYQLKGWVDRAFFVPSNKFEFKQLNRNQIDISAVTITSYQSKYVEIELSVDSSGVLVLTDTFYPGWKAYVNGSEVEIQKIDGFFRGVNISEAGTYNINFTYQPIWAKFILFYVLGLIICIFIPCLIYLKRKKSNV